MKKKTTYTITKEEKEQLENISCILYHVTDYVNTLLPKVPQSEMSNILQLELLTGSCYDTLNSILKNNYDKKEYNLDTKVQKLKFLQ